MRGAAPIAASMNIRISTAWASRPANNEAPNSIRKMPVKGNACSASKARKAISAHTNFSRRTRRIACSPAAVAADGEA